MQIDRDGVTLGLVTGDIARQPDVEAVVNAANAELRTGGGVAGALHRAAGPGLEAEARPLGPIRPGEAVLTGGHGLPNRHVIHVLGPVYGRDRPSDRLLADGYGTALDLADTHGIASVAFPALSTGVFGYPMEPAARVALSAVLERLPTLEAVRLVRFVLYSADDLAVHERVLRDLLDADA